MKSRKLSAFTLVELLVVIGIISLLIGILLPTLNRSRQAANAITCAANLRSIGQGIANYLANNRGVLPASNFYRGFTLDSVNGQQPLLPTQGYVHWSSYLYVDKDKLGTNQPFLTTNGWKAFTCPSIPNGGIPPANTYNGNHDAGLTNEVPGVIDEQAPRLAYTVNEALCPRGIFQLNFSNRGNKRIYKFIQASRVHNSADVILATELWGSQSAVETASLIDGSTPVSNSRRPVNGMSVTGTGGGVAPDSPYVLPYSSQFAWATPTDLTPDPEPALKIGGDVAASLDYVGRNHGFKSYGQVAGDSQKRANWDLRKTNFLYVDGHVETKHISQTLYPRNQWGQDFYTLDQ